MKGVATLSIVLAALLLVAALVSGDSGPAQHSHTSDEHPGASAVIVDTDMGLDDVRAIFALIGSEHVKIEAILTVDGSASAAKGADNVIGLLETARIGGIAVYRGPAGNPAAAPAWRGTSERLAGHLFPPPRRLRHEKLDAEGFFSILDRLDVRTRWLALGPMGNLARLEREKPGAIEKIDAVVIPARITGKLVDSWNLEFDLESARMVLEKATKIILVDVSIPDDPDPFDILSSVEGDSPAARWIRATTLEGINPIHIFIYDEVAVAALAAPEIFHTDDTEYTVDFEGAGLPRLVETAGGNVRLARVSGGPVLAGLLHRLWEEPRTPRGEHVHAPARAIDPLAMIKSFHGHLGPYVVLGYRMGRIALRETGSAGHFGLDAKVFSILEPPHSCLIDGVQLGSGCTLGKRNISVTFHDGPPYAIFGTDTGKRVIISLLPETTVLVSALVEEKGVEEAGEQIWLMDEEELFSIEQD